MDRLLNAVKAIGEPTRLRLLALCAEGDLTVSELVQIVGQSQPRVSRHLKVLCESGVLERFREGSWIFHRLSSDAGAWVGCLLESLPRESETLVLDRRRLAEVKAERAAAAQAYFEANAEQWDKIRSFHIDDKEVEAALLNILGKPPYGDILDIGVGTGRILELLTPFIRSGTGIDQSREMLAIARARLEEAASNCSVRQGDIYQIPFADESFDLAVIHQVLHYAEEPDRALKEAARVLRPGGRLVVVDFTPHDLEALREEHKHRRLGFADKELSAWFEKAGLKESKKKKLAGDPLTVGLWTAQRAAETE